jgi:hypothetical protein
MWIQAGALSPVPSYAIVSEAEVSAALGELADEAALHDRLGKAFRVLEAEQPALAYLLSHELETLERPSAQALLYYLFLLVFVAFRNAFGARIGRLEPEDLDATFERLLVDSQVRSQACHTESYSEDMIALGQPALLRLINGELDETLEDAADGAPILQALLTEVLALTQAVAP